MSVAPPTKNDPKYQTLPYNAKLFAPFSNNQCKHDRGSDQYESSVQQKLQIMQLDSHDGQEKYQHQQQQQLLQHQAQQKSNQILRNFNNHNLNNNNVQLQQLLSQNQHNAKSAHMSSQVSAPNLAYHHHQQQQQQQQRSSPIPPTAPTSNANGAAVTWSSTGTGIHENFYSGSSAIAGTGSRPSNFGPTGAPASVATPSSTNSSVPLHNTPSSISSGLPQVSACLLMSNHKTPALVGLKIS